MSSPHIDTDPFSDVADGYDASFTDLPAVGLVRLRIHALIERFFPPNGTVLDLACGTGEDAMLLARRGFQVIGADRSRGMLVHAAAKSCSMTVGPAFVQLDAASLSMFRDSAFDAILSNFGGLNCVPDLRSTLRECHRVLRSRGVMLLILLGAHSAWENGAFVLRGAWGSVLRRRTGAPVQVRLGQQMVDTWYYSLRSTRRAAAGLFDIMAIAGVNIVAPPPASRSFALRHPRLTDVLFSLDRKVESLPLVRALGDHSVFVLKRRASP